MNNESEFELLSACREILKKRVIASGILRDQAARPLEILDAAELLIEATRLEQTVWSVLANNGASERTQRYCLELMAAEYEQ